MLFKLVARLLIIIWILNVADDLLLIGIVYYSFVSIEKRKLSTYQQYNIKLWFFNTQ